MDGLTWDSRLGLTVPTATGERILLPRLWDLAPRSMASAGVLLDRAGLAVRVTFGPDSISIAAA